LVVTISKAINNVKTFDCDRFAYGLMVTKIFSRGLINAAL